VFRPVRGTLTAIATPALTINRRFSTRPLPTGAVVVVRHVHTGADTCMDPVATVATSAVAAREVTLVPRFNTEVVVRLGEILVTPLPCL
jgi:hypothetical protein